MVLQEQIHITVGETKQLLPFLFGPFKFDVQKSKSYFKMLVSHHVYEIQKEKEYEKYLNSPKQMGSSRI